MKKLLLLLLFAFTATVSAQDVTGVWHGQLVMPGAKLKLDINITKAGSGYTATMDSPDQGVEGIPVTTITFANSTLEFAIPQGNLSYKGQFADNVIKGTFLQNGNNIPLTLSREAVKEEKVKHSQEPAKPFPYYEEEVTFKNDKAGITLAGTLTLPKKEGSYPAVILVSGSGPQNRNAELLGHKSFLVLSDYFTRNGFAVLRYDDRGTAASKGDFTTATTKDFATDADAAFTYLTTRKEINKNKIGIAGHSEGGAVAPMVAANNPKVAFVVMIAGPGIPCDELMVLQNYLINKAEGMPEEELNKIGTINRNVYSVIKQEQDTKAMKAGVEAVFNSQMKPLFISKGIPETQVNSMIKVQAEQLTSPWFVEFLRYDPAPVLEKVKCPLLALNGSNDTQVAAKANLDGIKRATAKSGNKKVTIKEMPGLNHLFQTSATGAPSEYEEIDETFSPKAMSEILAWMQQQVN